MPERLRIAQVITRLDRGGSSDMVIALCERLDPERFDVTLVTGPAADPVEEPAALARRLGITAVECPHLAREVRPRADLRALLGLRSAFEKMRPHVVHAHTSKAGALARLAARLAGVPAVYSPHGHLFYGYYGKVGTALVVLAERVLASVGRQRIAVLTDESRAEHLARGIGRFDQFVTIPSGIDLKRFVRDDAARRAMRSELRLAPEDFAAGWVGRFVEVKGPDVFIEACGLIAKDLPNAVFVSSTRATRTYSHRGTRGWACRWSRRWRAARPSSRPTSAAFGICSKTAVSASWCLITADMNFSTHMRRKIHISQERLRGLRTR